MRSAGDSLTMVLEDLGNAPVFSMLSGYSMRALTADDGGRWADVWNAADPFFDVAPDRFRQEFGMDDAPIRTRCFAVLDESGHAVGTGSAWFDDDFRGEAFGRVHWMGVVPEHQGRGLGKGTLSCLLQTLRQWHLRAYLKTRASPWPRSGSISPSVSSRKSVMPPLRPLGVRLRRRWITRLSARFAARHEFAAYSPGTSRP